MMMGLRRHFKSRSVRIVEFEYHGINAWSKSGINTASTHGFKFTLKQVVRNMDRYGYDCYFEGQPTLTRLTRCWREDYEFRSWSNVVCVDRNDDVWYHVLDSMALWLDPSSPTRGAKAKIKKT